MIALGLALISAFAGISQTLAASAAWAQSNRRRLACTIAGTPKARVAPGATTASVLDNSVAVTSLELAPE
jgi:hypothetical protein